MPKNQESTTNFKATSSVTNWKCYSKFQHDMQRKQLKSNYVNIKNNDKKPQHKKEIANAIRFREDVEMNILYRKEQHLNQLLSYLNMDGVYQYEGIRENFKLNIDENLCRFVQFLYQT